MLDYPTDPDLADASFPALRAAAVRGGLEGHRAAKELARRRERQERVMAILQRIADRARDRRDAARRLS